MIGTGRSFQLLDQLENGGLITGLVRVVDHETGAAGIMADLLWEKKASRRTQFYRGEISAMLAVEGMAYPQLNKSDVPPIGLGQLTPNARLQLGGSSSFGAIRDVLLDIIPGRVSFVGFDPASPGAELDLGKLRLNVQAPAGTFSGRFRHPQTDKTVRFKGAFRVPFDDQPGVGAGVIRSAGESGSVRFLAE